MNKAVLYVDDEPINVMLFELNFKNKFTTFVAKSAKEAIEIFRQNPEIALVITDMKMPEMTGVELAYELKKEFKNVHIFILTGYEILPEIDVAINDSVIERYYSKPYDIDSLANDIRSFAE